MRQYFISPRLRNTGLNQDKDKEPLKSRLLFGRNFLLNMYLLHVDISDVGYIVHKPFACDIFAILHTVYAKRTLKKKKKMHGTFTLGHFADALFQSNLKSYSNNIVMLLCLGKAHCILGKHTASWESTLRLGKALICIPVNPPPLPWVHVTLMFNLGVLLN